MRGSEHKWGVIENSKRQDKFMHYIFLNLSQKFLGICSHLGGRRLQLQKLFAQKKTFEIFFVIKKVKIFISMNQNKTLIIQERFYYKFCTIHMTYLVPHKRLIHLLIKTLLVLNNFFQQFWSFLMTGINNCSTERLQY